MSDHRKPIPSRGSTKPRHITKPTKIRDVPCLWDTAHIAHMDTRRHRSVRAHRIALAFKANVSCQLDCNSTQKLFNSGLNISRRGFDILRGG
jgi:hypothetical protein